MSKELFITKNLLIKEKLEKERLLLLIECYSKEKNLPELDITISYWI